MSPAPGRPKRGEPLPEGPRAARGELKPDPAPGRPKRGEPLPEGPRAARGEPRSDPAPSAGGAPAMKSIWVVKLGGSLARSRELPHWLRACAALAGRVVLVPGGGPYADAVRRAQRAQGFDDAAAHALALGAMEQFGRQLCALQAGLIPAATAAALREALAAGLTPVWMARAMVLADAGIAPNWSVTSDSLAAWLAHGLRADGLVLVKSVAAATADIHALAAAGVVDAAFPRWAAGLQSLRLLHRTQWNSLADVLHPPQAARHQPEARHV